MRQVAEISQDSLTTIKKLKINRTESSVVVEGSVHFQNQENQTSSVANSDVYQFSDGQLVEIPSYYDGLNKPSELK